MSDLYRISPATVRDILGYSPGWREASSVEEDLEDLAENIHHGNLDAPEWVACRLWAGIANMEANKSGSVDVYPNRND